MLYYAELNGDHDRVISHHVQRREWTKALDVLAKCPDASLYYVHSPTLMQVRLVSGVADRNVCVCVTPLVGAMCCSMRRSGPRTPGSTPRARARSSW